MSLTTLKAGRLGGPGILLDDLISYWRFGEVSGQRVDSFGTNHLTDNNTVTQKSPGKVGDAAQFAATNLEYLSRPDNSSLSVGNIPFAFTLWALLDTKPAVARMIGKFNTAGDQRDYIIDFVGGATDRFRFGVSADGTSAGTKVVTANSFGAPILATWNFIVVQHDPTADLISIQINNGIVDSVAHSTGVFNSTTEFNVGRDANGSYWNGAIDEISFWKRLLTANEITRMYNNGSGIPLF